jgi:hypothetical protein
MDEVRSATKDNSSPQCKIGIFEVSIRPEKTTVFPEFEKGKVYKKYMKTIQSHCSSGIHPNKVEFGGIPGIHH